MNRFSPLLRRAVIVVAAAGIAIGASACDPAPASAPTKTRAAASSSDAAQALRLINDYRAAHGLPTLTQAADATAKAQQHANDMAAQGRLFHSSSLASGIQPGWSALGENVGVGGSVSQIESMFQASGPHNANLLSPNSNQVGVGVARGANGQLYVTQFFVGR